MRRPASGVRLPNPPRRMGRLAAALLGLVLAAAPLGAQKRPAAAAEDCAPEPNAHSLCFRHIDAEYSVLRGGDVLVAERFTVRFNGSWNGMTRQLVRRATAHDRRSAEQCDARPAAGYRGVDIDVLGATDERGNPLDIESETNDERIDLRIWVPGANDADRVVILRYRIDDGVTFICGHDEFYWNVLGSTSTFPVAHMDVRIIPPSGTTGLRAEAYAGAEGSRGELATVRVDSLMIAASTTQPLGPGLGFTVVAGWDSGVVEQPGALERFLDWLARWWSFALPVAALAFMWSRWSRRGRDPAMLPIVTQYEPPAGLTPGEVGTLLDERADMRDVTATLVDLAVQGRLRIDETEGTKLLGMEFGESYRFVRTEPPPGAPPPKEHEARLLAALFGDASQVELEELKNEFYKDLPGIREAMMDCLVSRGVYTKRPDRARAAWIIGAIVIGIGLFPLLGNLDATHPLALVAVPILTALPIAIFGALMPRRTVPGTRLVEKLRGFREFLARVDGDRLRRMRITSDAFERILPYAMALGVEKKWGEAFDGLAQEPPRWYQTRNGRPFRPAVFASDLGRMSTATAGTMSSRPNSSGSGGSGFGGGGSVGGGGGGGGVGGF